MIITYVGWVRPVYSMSGDTWSMLCLHKLSVCIGIKFNGKSARFQHCWSKIMFNYDNFYVRYFNIDLND